MPAPAGGPVAPEGWDARAGGRLRSVLTFVPGLLYAFGYVGFLFLITLLAPRFSRPRRHRLIRGWGHGLRWILGIRLECHGAARLAAPGPAIVLFNHQSLLDLLLLTSLWPQNATVLYKQEFHAVPLFGTVMRRLGMIPIDRSNRAAAITSLRAAGRKLLDEGTKVLIAPEGTRSRRGGLLPFKRGPFHLALQTGMPVVPMVFRGVATLWPQGSLLARPGTARADVLEPLDTTGWTEESLDEHMAALRALYLRYVPPAASG